MVRLRRGGTPRLTARDVAGVPVIPPAWLAGWATRWRASVGRAHRAMAPPPVQILEGLFGLLDHGALVALRQLGVADALVEWTTVDVLARRLGVAPDRLARLTRYGAARGWLRLDRRGRLGPNRVTAFLRTAHPGGWAAWPDFVGGPEVRDAVGALADAIRMGADPFTLANGSSFFDWMAVHPERRDAFDRAMSAGGRMHGLALARALDWSSARRVCDVGGGDGALLRTLLVEHPHLEGVLFDLVEVTDRAPVADRLEISAGDAFEHLPAGCDTYLYVNVLHDWADVDATRLLIRAANDASPAARIVVVDGRLAAKPADDIATRTDLLMLALAPGGRERTTAEFADLGRRAGLHLEQCVPLASGDVAHVFARRTAS